MRRALHFHCGLDEAGSRCWRMRGVAEVRRCRERQRLQPKISAQLTCGPGRELWRSGMHQRRWLLLLAQLRGDRRCFLMTLKRPPLIAPTLPF